ncbi:hypothetical protein BC941DRAFT_407192 [Chlamydoabsidia padenii]|nr:hypothetical protein BC941DRAFT_407192 [Chlamydoabsidia padenii]
MAQAETVLNLFKQRHGVLLKRSFYNNWYQARSGAGSNTPEQLYESMLIHFLNTDIAASSEPILQQQGIGKHMMTLQLQDTLDTSHSLSVLIDALDKKGPISRGNLKWIMTDGAQDIMVYELGKNTLINLKTPFGSKIQITTGQYVDGLLLVKPECMKLLGGQIKVLYGDTMENELLRRYKQRLKDQSSQSRNVSRPSASIPAYQNRTPINTTITAERQITNTNNLPSTTTTRAMEIDIDDDEFDDLPMDDFADFDELEQQAIGSLSTTLINGVTRPTLPLTDNRSSSIPKRPPSLSLSTKFPKKTSTQSISPQNRTTSSSSSKVKSPPIIQLDVSPPPSLSSLNSSTRHTELDFEDLMMDDDFAFDDLDDPKPPVPKLITVAELRKLLRMVDDDSFTGGYDKVTVKVQGCKLKTMKPIPNKGLYLVAELLDEHSHEQRILVSFVYYGINSLFEGYTVADLHQMKKQHGLSVVREKVFKPLCVRFYSIKAELEIDLMLTENDESGLVRKGTKFTVL